MAALWRFWQLDGHVAEGHAWVQAVFAMPGADEPPARLGALAAAGGIAYWRGDREEALDLYTAQLSLAEQLGDQAAAADAYFNLAAANFIAATTRSRTAARRRRAGCTRARRRGRRQSGELGSGELGLHARRPRSRPGRDDGRP